MGAVDKETFQRLVEWQVGEGSSGLAACGTTGESPTLSHKEHKRVVELTVEAAKRRIAVIAGAGSNNTIEAVELSTHAERAGADAVLIAAPYYSKTVTAKAAVTANRPFTLLALEAVIHRHFDRMCRHP